MGHERQRFGDSLIDFSALDCFQINVIRYQGEVQIVVNAVIVFFGDLALMRSIFQHLRGVDPERRRIRHLRHDHFARARIERCDFTGRLAAEMLEQGVVAFGKRRGNVTQ